MTWTSVQPATGLTRSTRHSADSVEDRRVRCRLALDSAWQRKIDEVVMLSKAYGPASDDDGRRPDRGAYLPSRLLARTDRAYDELAAIEEAIARIEDGTYGTCAGCGQSMSDEWLSDEPEVRYCPDCSLCLVTWAGPPRPALASV